MHTLDRRDFLGLAVAAGAATALPAFGRVAPHSSDRLDHTYFQHASLRRGDTIHGIMGEGGNSLLLVTDDASLLIDCKNAPFGRVLKNDCVTLGARTGHKQLVVVNTHHHGDHTAGNHAFNEGSTIWCHQNAIPRFEGNMDWYRAMGQQAVRQLRMMPEDKAELARDAIMAYAEKLSDLTPGHFTPPTSIDTERFELDLGGRSATVHHFGPGHTDNDLVVHLEDANVVHTGDLVFHRFNPFMDPNGGCDPRRWIDVLKNVDGLCDADTVVVPGHGAIGDRSIIAGQIEYIERLFEAVAAEIKTGTSREAIIAKTFDFQQGFSLEMGRTASNSFVYDLLTQE